MFNSWDPHGLYPTRFLCPWDFPSKNTGVACHFLLQGIFFKQGSNSRLLCLLHCRQILYHWAAREARDIAYGRAICTYQSTQYTWYYYFHLEEAPARSTPKLNGWSKTAPPPVCVCLAAQLCPVCCDPMDRSLPSSSVHGVLQAGTLEWVPRPPHPTTLPGASTPPGTPVVLPWQCPLQVRSTYWKHTS